MNPKERVQQQVIAGQIWHLQSYVNSWALTEVRVKWRYDMIKWDTFRTLVTGTLFQDVKTRQSRMKCLKCTCVLRQKLIVF